MVPAGVTCGLLFASDTARCVGTLVTKMTKPRESLLLRRAGGCATPVRGLVAPEGKQRFFCWF